MTSVATAAIATSDPRATETGARVLRAGGNCVDAAVAAALVLFVVEPHHCGPGGDAFLLTQLPGMDAPVALDGAGAVPSGLDAAALARDGLDAVPPFGARSVTVPGALAMLETATERFGSRDLRDLVTPAIDEAENGFEAQPSLADAIAGSRGRLARDPVLAALFLRDDEPVGVGARIKNPALAQLLDELARRGSEVISDGRGAAAIADAVGRGGGYLTRDDLAAHRTLEVEPCSTMFEGATVWELPLPTQGPAVLAALERLRAHDPHDWRGVADAIRLGLLDVGVDLVDAPWVHRQGGTSHLAVVDGAGGVASLITSVFAPFGSGVGVDALGAPLQNRAAGFLLLGRPPASGKPPHTIIPGLVTRHGDAEMAIGVAGGLMQAQGQVQLLVRTLAAGETVRAAVEAPRLRVVEGGELALEPGHPLAERFPEATERPPGDGGFGCAQLATRRDGEVLAVADPRRRGADQIVPVHGEPSRESGAPR